MSKPGRAAYAYAAAFLLCWSACEAPFGTSGSTAAPPDSVPADTAIDIGRPRPDTADTATGPARPPSDSVPAGSGPVDSIATPPGLDSGFARGGGVRVVPVFDPARVALAKPVWFGALPGRSDAYIALEQYSGAVVLIRKTAEGWARGEFLKLSVRGDGEMGLLGIAFHPRFSENRKYYLHYVPASGELATVIEEREADASLLKDSGKPARLILRLAQPYQNHKSAGPAFGPKDGYLYLATGDGGATVAGQDRSRLLGKILRVDVNAPDSFRVPPDNPFLDKPGTRPEIWALGLRNPWRWSFDALTGDMWIGDVGEDQREEIDIARAGDNLGWGFMEGTMCHLEDSCRQALAPPVADFGRGEMTTLIGGYVYRGDPASPWYGTYFFADYGSHALWALGRGPDGKPSGAKKLLLLPTAPSSFGTDAAGNLYLVGYGNGAVYRLEIDAGDPGRGRL